MNRFGSVFSVSMSGVGIAFYVRERKSRKNNKQKKKRTHSNSYRTKADGMDGPYLLLILVRFSVAVS